MDDASKINFARPDAQSYFLQKIQSYKQLLQMACGEVERELIIQRKQTS